MGILCYLLLLGCGQEEKDELSGPLGAGAGGQAVNPATVVSHDFTDESGASIGVFAYDAGFLLHYHPDPATPDFHVLATVTETDFVADILDNGRLDNLQAEDVVIGFTRIVGRPDTPCRVQAALLARDDDYEILGSGDRTNDQALEFHQVNLTKPSLPLAQNFYCAQMAGNLGIQANVVTLTEPEQAYVQVHYVLNAISDN